MITINDIIIGIKPLIEAKYEGFRAQIDTIIESEWLSKKQKGVKINNFLDNCLEFINEANIQDFHFLPKFAFQPLIKFIFDETKRFYLSQGKRNLTDRDVAITLTFIKIALLKQIVNFLRENPIFITKELLNQVTEANFILQDRLWKLSSNLTENEIYFQNKKINTKQELNKESQIATARIYAVNDFIIPKRKWIVGGMFSVLSSLISGMMQDDDKALFEKEVAVVLLLALSLLLLSTFAATSITEHRHFTLFRSYQDAARKLQSHQPILHKDPRIQKLLVSYYEIFVLNNLLEKKNKLIQDVHFKRRHKPIEKKEEIDNQSMERRMPRT